MEKLFDIDHSFTLHFTKEPKYGFESVCIEWVEDGQLKSKVIQEVESVRILLEMKNDKSSKSEDDTNI